MPTEEHQYLDQAIDSSARIYGDTAQDYALYLGGEYATNREKSHDRWQNHYENVRAEIVGHVMDLGIPRRNMNMAIIGPGLSPIGAEIGLTEERKIIQKVRQVVVADFSPTVVDKAIEQMKRRIPREKSFLPMLIDVTDGLSTAYRRLSLEAMQNVETEDQLMEASAKLAAMNIEKLRTTLIELLTDVDCEQIESLDFAHSAYPEIFYFGGLNNTRERYKLSINGGDELPLHSIIMPLVIAGTGAAAEHEIWTKYKDVLASDAEKPASRLDDFVRNIYKLITRYNTLAASKSIGDILDDNPEAQLLAITDISTAHYHGDLGVMNRLDLEQLSELLDKKDILLKRPRVGWEWHDQPDEHYHQVEALLCKKRCP